MTRTLRHWSSPYRIASALGLVAVVGGLSLAMRLAGGSDHSLNTAIMFPIGEGVAISTPLRLSERLPLTIDRGLILSVAGEQGVSGSVIDAAAITLDFSKDRVERTYSAFEAGPSGASETAALPSDTVRLTRALITVIGPTGTTVQFVDVDATVSMNRKGSHKLVATGRLNDQPIALDVIWTEPAASQEAAQLPMRLTLRSPVLELSLDGHYASGTEPQFVGDAEFQLPSLKRFAKWSGLGRGVGNQFRSITVSGPVDWTTKRIAFAKANISVNGNHATGAMTVKHADGRLSFDGTLGFSELDLGRSWPSFASHDAKRDKGPHILTALDADLRLSATKVYGPTFEMGRAAVSIVLNKGRLQADVAELEIEGGVAGGQFAMDLGQAVPQAQFKAKLSGVDTGRILATSLRRNALLGRTNLVFEGTIGGQAGGDGLSSIAGRGVLDLAEPGRVGVDVLALMHAARAAPTVGWSAAGKGGTQVESLTTRFRVLNGALTIESLQARAGTSVLVGSGRLDVPARLMDVSIAAGPVNAGEAPITAQDILLLRGTWDTPAISLLPRASATSAGPLPPVRLH